VRAGALALLLACGAPGANPATAPTASIWVRSEAQFEGAVAALRESGGTILLLPHVYAGELLVGARGERPLRILGTPGAQVERIRLDRAQQVSIGGLTVSPVSQDARIEVVGSRYVELHDLLVSARGTRHSASVSIPDSSHVTIRRSTFTHCGDRSPSFVNCLLLSTGASHVTVADSWFHDCYGCDFVHGRFGSDLRLLRNRFERSLPCRIGPVRCGHQDLVELFAGQRLLVEGNHFGVYRVGGAQLYLTNAIDHVTVVNNVFVGTDPLVPGYRSRMGMIIGSRATLRVPHYVRVVNNTILTGSTRSDGYEASLRMSSVYLALPRRLRPILANNVIGLLETPARVCNGAAASVSNVVLRGSGCSPSDRVGPAGLDSRARPTAASALLIDHASRRYAPATDLNGSFRRGRPDIGAYEYVPAIRRAGSSTRPALQFGTSTSQVARSKLPSDGALRPPEEEDARDSDRRRAGEGRRRGTRGRGTASPARNLRARDPGRRGGG